MFENGEIVEQGTHSELLSKNEKYADMWHKQADTYADAEEIRERYVAGETQRTLAKAYGISKSSVGEIVRRETYRNPPKTMHSGRV